MRTIKIDHDIPIPPRKPRRGLVIPWQSMAVGDSFRVLAELAGCISARMTDAARRFGYRFRRQQTRHGIRVWRIE